MGVSMKTFFILVVLIAGLTASSVGLLASARRAPVAAVSAADLEVQLRSCRSAADARAILVDANKIVSAGGADYAVAKKVSQSASAAIVRFEAEEREAKIRAEQQVARAREEVVRAREEAAAAQEARRAGEAKIAAAGGTVEALSAEVARLTADLQAGAVVNMRLQAHCEQLRADAVREAAAKATELAAQVAKNSGLAEQIRAVQNELQQVRFLMAQKEQQGAALLQKNQQQRDVNARLQREIAQVSAQNEAAEARVTAAEAEKNQECARVQAEKDEAVQEAARLGSVAEARIAAIQQAVAAVTVNLQASQAALAEQAASKAVIERENARVKADLTRVRGAQDEIAAEAEATVIAAQREKDEECARAREEAALSQAALRAGEARLAEAGGTVEALRAEVSAQVAQNSRLAAEIQAVQNKLQQVERQMAQKEQQRAVLLQENQQQCDVNARLQQEIGQVQAENAAAIARAQAEKERAQQEAEARVAAAEEEQVRECAALRTEKESVTRQAQADVAVAQARALQLEEGNATGRRKFEDENRILQQQVDAHNTELQALRGQLAAEQAQQAQIAAEAEASVIAAQREKDEEVVRAREEAAAAQEALRAGDARVAAGVDAAGALSAEVTRLTADLQAGAAVNVRLQKSCESQRADAVREAAVKATELAAQVAQNSGLATQIQDVQNELQQMQRYMAEKEREQQEAERQAATIKTQHEQAVAVVTAELEASQAALAQQAASKAVIEGEIASVNAELDRVRAAQDEITVQTEARVRAVEAEKSQESARLQREIAQVRAENAAAIVAAQAEKELAAQEAASHIAEVQARCEEAVSAVRAELEASRAALAAQRQKNGEISAQLESREQDIQRAMFTIQSLVHSPHTEDPERTWDFGQLQKQNTELKAENTVLKHAKCKVCEQAAQETDGEWERLMATSLDDVAGGPACSSAAAGGMSSITETVLAIEREKDDLVLRCEALREDNQRLRQAYEEMQVRNSALEQQYLRLAEECYKISQELTILDRVADEAVKPEALLAKKSTFGALLARVRALGQAFPKP